MDDVSLERRMSELSEVITTCEKVREALETDGGKNIIEMIRKMIIDCNGGFVEGRFVRGNVDDARLGEEKAKAHIHYRRALVDVYENIHSFVDNLPKYRSEFKYLEEEQKEEKNPSFTQPMQDTQY